MKSERGAAVLVMVLGLSILVGVLVYVANRYLENTMNQVTMQRDRMAALQVLQDFALLAQKANEVWVNNAGVCPASAPQLYPALNAFCWNAAQNCVKNPIGGNNANICLVIPNAAASAAQTLMVAKNSEDGIPALEAVPEYPSRWSQMVAYAKDVFRYRREIVAVAQRDLINAVGGEAHALRPDLHLPGVGAPDPVGPSQNTINNRGCNNAGWPAEYCKVCGGLPTQVRCLELRVCVSPLGCRNIASPAPGYYKDWFRQRIGILPR